MLAAVGHASDRPAVILDVDPGHDDVIAMAVAAAHTRVVGITTVTGNAPLADTTRNALIMRDLLGLDAPVHQGAARPLVGEPQYAPAVHGVTGLDGADLPEPSGPPAGHDAASFIVDTCRATEGLWLIPTGPLTNIARALQLAPDLARRIAGISLMGGGSFGNWTPTAEFNILNDPEAAAIVFGYGGPLIMCGLDVTHQLQATPERIDAVRATPGRLAAALADLLHFFSEMYVSRHHHMRGAAVHDPCAVLSITHPQLFTHVPRHVAVETTGTLTRGMTVIDRRDLLDVPPPNCRVAESIDDTGAFAVIVQSIASAAAPTTPESS